MILMPIVHKPYSLRLEKNMPVVTSFEECLEELKNFHLKATRDLRCTVDELSRENAKLKSDEAMTASAVKDSRYPSKLRGRK